VTTSYSILVPVSDSVSSQAVVDFVSQTPFCPEDARITLLHLYRKPSASEELMGRKFTEQQPQRYQAFLEKAKDQLVEQGFNPRNIETKLISDPYPTVAEGIMDQFKKGGHDLVVIGRKRMTKAEEFVLGDISVKLVRALGAAVLVVKSE